MYSLCVMYLSYVKWSGRRDSALMKYIHPRTMKEVAEVDCVRRSCLEDNASICAIDGATKNANESTISFEGRSVDKFLSICAGGLHTSANIS